MLARLGVMVAIFARFSRSPLSLKVLKVRPRVTSRGHGAAINKKGAEDARLSRDLSRSLDFEEHASTQGAANGAVRTS